MQQGDEQETFIQIIGESKKKLQTLKILSNFFNHKVLIAALIRTKVVHNLFENNKSLDIHKLELFHIQYTNSLIDLFRKLKKSKEQLYMLIADEIYINADFIAKLKQEAESGFFKDESKNHAVVLSQKIEQLYRIFSFDEEKPFRWNEVTLFSNRRAPEYYRELSEVKFRQLTHHEDEKVYTNSLATFERKLLGKLNIQKFRIKFVCGFRFDSQIAEVYDFVDSNDRFLFLPAHKSFYLLDANNLHGIDLSANLSTKHQIIEEMTLKNAQLREKQSMIKSQLPNDVEIVLQDYVAKISDVNFINDLQNVDEQTNILRTMLNININSNNGN